MTFKENYRDTVPIRPTLHARDHFNFPIIPKNRHKSRKNYWRGQKKSGVTRDRRVGRIGTVLHRINQMKRLNL